MAKPLKQPKAASPAEQLSGFIQKFSPADQKLFRAVRAAMRARLPSANELVWDNYNFLVIGYSPTERPTDSIFSIAARANGIGLCFIQGARLPDPEKLLQGTGKQTRFVRLESVETLSSAAVEDLIAATLERADPALPSSGRGKLIIRSVSDKQRPRVAAKRPRR